MKQSKILILAASAAFAAATLSSAAFAAGNPFALPKSDNGYQLAGHDTAKTGDKCGTGNKKAGKCSEGMGEQKAEGKKMEGKCGEGKCGANKSKMKENKCGAGKSEEKK